MNLYVVHLLITHAHYTIETVKIVSVDRVWTLNVTHQQLTQPEGSSRLKQIQRRLEVEQVGISAQ